MIKIFCFLVIFIFQLILCDQKLTPIIFYHNAFKGSDWIYEDKQVTIFGAGIKGYFKNKTWSIRASYIQFGFLGNVYDGLFNFSPRQSFAYIDDSKDADGYWSEYLDTKIAYSKGSLILEFGKFDRHWGFGKRAIHISNKTPSYPQFGMNWKMNDKLTLIYFHGFLNSGINDSTRSHFYNNSFSKRKINLPRNIASHRIEWQPTNNLILGINESVVYAARNLDIHYLIPFSLFYPIENYLGDTDNLQMGFDFSYLFKEDHRLYFGFFMDELTPEWIFNSKNHNWFAYQLGYSSNEVIFSNSTLTIEYNWTDQRIYKHKYEINDFYSHGEPLGFWAGPHSEELLALYSLNINDYKINIYYTRVKRGYINDAMIETHYNDTYNKRYSDGYELKTYLSAKAEKVSAIKGLNYNSSISWIEFENLGMPSSFSNINKLSIELGVYYNFKSGIY